VISPAGFKTPADAVKAFIDSKARIAVICSTDDSTPRWCRRWPRASGAVAGRGDRAGRFSAGPGGGAQKSGVDEFIHLRADAVELLTKCHHRLAIV